MELSILSILSQISFELLNKSAAEHCRYPWPIFQCNIYWFIQKFLWCQVSNKVLKWGSRSRIFILNGVLSSAMVHVCCEFRESGSICSREQLCGQGISLKLLNSRSKSRSVLPITFLTPVKIKDACLLWVWWNWINFQMQMQNFQIQNYLFMYSQTYELVKKSVTWMSQPLLSTVPRELLRGQV